MLLLVFKNIYGGKREGKMYGDEKDGSALRALAVLTENMSSVAKAHAGGS